MEKDRKNESVKDLGALAQLLGDGEVDVKEQPVPATRLRPGDLLEFEIDSIKYLRLVRGGDSSFDSPEHGYVDHDEAEYELVGHRRFGAQQDVQFNGKAIETGGLSYRLVFAVTLPVPPQKGDIRLVKIERIKSNKFGGTAFCIDRGIQAYDDGADEYRRWRGDDWLVVRRE